MSDLETREHGTMPADLPDPVEPDTPPRSAQAATTSLGASGDRGGPSVEPPPDSIGDADRDPGKHFEDDLFDDDPETVSVLALLLDMGGVILDLGEARGLPWGELDRRGRRALLERIRDAGGEADEEDLDRWLFDPWRRGYEHRRRVGREERWGPHLARLQRRAGTAGVTRGALLEAWARPFLESLRPVSGAQEALGRLASADLRLALVSNVPLPGVFYRRVLEREGLAAFFATLQLSYDQGARKPGPVLLRRALERMGVDRDEAVMVGDRRSTDVGAGRSAGMRTVWVESADRDGPEPDAAVGSIAEVPELLGL